MLATFVASGGLSDSLSEIRYQLYKLLLELIVSVFLLASSDGGFEATWIVHISVSCCCQKFAIFLTQRPLRDLFMSEVCRLNMA